MTDTAPRNVLAQLTPDVPLRELVQTAAQLVDALNAPFLTLPVLTPGRSPVSPDGQAMRTVPLAIDATAVQAVQPIPTDDTLLSIDPGKCLITMKNGAAPQVIDLPPYVVVRALASARRAAGVPHA